MSAPRRYLYYGLCWVIGGLFIYAGGSKLANPILSAEAVRNYELLVDPWVTVVGLWLPWVEIVAGSLLLIQCWVAGALSVVGGCSVVFLIGRMSAWIRGLDISCGCFGPPRQGVGYGPLDYALHIAALLVLMVVCVWLWRQAETLRRGAVAAS